MTDYKLSAIHPLRRVIWSLLKNELGWNESDYDGVVPVLTPQQEPEVNLAAKPYVVYNYAKQGSDENYWLKEEQAVFVIYSDDEEDIRKVINMMSRYFEHYDASANYVNWWIEDHGSPLHKQFEFKWIRVVSTIGAGPAEQEGGRQNGVVTLRYQFTQYEPVEANDLEFEGYGRPTPPE